MKAGLQGPVLLCKVVESNGFINIHKNELTPEINSGAISDILKKLSNPKNAFVVRVSYDFLNKTLEPLNLLTLRNPKISWLNSTSSHHKQT